MVSGLPCQRPLLATEHGAFDQGAEALAFALAQRFGVPLAAVLALGSNAIVDAEAPDVAARADAEAARAVRALSQAAAQAGVALALSVRRADDVGDAILAERAATGADLLVLRRRGPRGFLARLLVGEMVSRVIAQAPCSVLVAPRAAAWWTRRVLAAIDPAAPAPGLAAAAAAVAAASGLPLTLLCVADSPAQRAAADASLATALAEARQRGVRADARIRSGPPAAAVAAERLALGADLLLLGKPAAAGRGRSGLGATVQAAIGQADCPVWLQAASPPP